MERDYATRQKKLVYRFEPGRQGLHRWTGPLLNPTVFSAYSRRDLEVVRQVVSLMKRRFIQHGADWEPPQSLEFVENMVEYVRQLLEKRGYVVLFWSAQAAESQLVSAELDMALRAYPNQIVVAKIDDTPMPQSLVHLSSRTNVVDLETDYRQSRLHTIDDLIVRLYWLISQNTGEISWVFSEVYFHRPSFPAAEGDSSLNHSVRWG
jgi:hypothetical protein